MRQATILLFVGVAVVPECETIPDKKRRTKVASALLLQLTVTTVQIKGILFTWGACFASVFFLYFFIGDLTGDRR